MDALAQIPTMRTRAGQYSAGEVFANHRFDFGDVDRKPFTMLFTFVLNKTRLLLAPPCAMCLVAALAAFSTAAGEALFTVNVDQNKVMVNPLLYGIFLEDINHTGDGGIYAELIRDRSFESTADPCAERTRYLPDNLHPKSEKTAWSFVQRGMAQGSMAFDDMPPLLNSAQQRCCRLDIASVGPGERVAVANEGYWGSTSRKAPGMNSPCMPAAMTSCGAKCSRSRWKTSKVMCMSARKWAP